MWYVNLCNLNLDTYITVEAATLIGLTFVTATSFILRSVMARKKKSAAAKAAAAAAQQSATTPKPEADAQGQLVPAKPVIVEVDNRPETSPYGSPACTVPFANPLIIPLDILKKSPKLHAAYEGRVPELSSIPEDVGHVLVHYLHTGTYESLKPKPTDSMFKQICELKTSIQAYAAARTYDLPELMRLAEAKIDKYGEGLPLPALLEVARDAYPTLTEGDDWFLEYLRSRIRPHLKDPESLLGSNLLDQISSILSPNRVLLRTVLELFCERITVRPEPITAPVAGLVTSPGSSRPVTPHALPPASPMSLLEMRSRAILREEFPSPTGRKKSSTLPSPESPLQLEAKPVEPTPEPGPVILDVVPQPELASKVQPVVAEVETAPSPKDNAMELGLRGAGESELPAVVEPEIRPAVEPYEEAVQQPALVSRRGRKDSGKEIELEPAIKELERPVTPPNPEGVARSESQTPNPLAHIQRRPGLDREVDSGFWDFTPAEAEAAKDSESKPIILGAVPLPVPAPEPSVHEFGPGFEPEDAPGVDTRDFADIVNTDGDKTVNILDEPPKEALATPVLAPEVAQPQPASEMEHTSDNLKGNEVAEPGVEKSKSSEHAQSEDREEAKMQQPETETEKLPDLAPICSESPALANPQSPEAGSSSTQPIIPLPDDSHPHGPPQSPETQPSLDNSKGSQPAGESTVQVVTDADDTPIQPTPANNPVSRDEKPEPAQPQQQQQPEDTKDKDPAVVTVQPAPACGVQAARQKSWKKRFLSLRYPVLFGRGM